MGVVFASIPGIGLQSGKMSGVDHKLSIPRTDSLLLVSMTRNVDQINGAVRLRLSPAQIAILARGYICCSDPTVKANPKQRPRATPVPHFTT